MSGGREASSRVCTQSAPARADAKIGAALLALCGLLLWAGAAHGGELKPWTGGATPALALRDPTGKLHKLADYRGKVVVVNFWATWCPYCRKEKPAIDAFWQDYRDRGFEVISISVDDPPEKIAAWMQDKDYAFMAAPTNASVTAAFGNIASVPTSFIVDTEGHVRHKIAGQVHYARLEKLVAPLLRASAQ